MLTEFVVISFIIQTTQNFKHFSIICTIENPKFKAPKPETLIFRVLKTMNNVKFRNDLEIILIPLMCHLLNSKSNAQHV